MKMKLTALVFLAGTLAFAQAPQPKEPTIAELKLALAQAQVQIAMLTAQLHDAQFQLQLYDGATGTAKRRQDDERELEAAQKAVQDATPKQEPGK